MRSNTLAIAVVLGCVLVAPQTIYGQGRGRGQEAKSAKQEKKAEKKADKQKADAKADKDVVVVDRDGHVRVIREQRAAGLPPGLAKRQSLPPGLRRQLVERGQLPPGLQRHLVDVPAPWVARMPAVPNYYHRYFAGDDLVVVDTRTNRIVAIVRDVLR
jgi:hypothetical protein